MRSVIETPLHDDFQCGCGCTWDTGGFDPCHEQEHLRGPDIGSGWDRTYICNDCGQVYRDTSETVSVGAIFVASAIPLGRAFLDFPEILGPLPDGETVPELRETVHNWRDPSAEKRN